ncbi:hypothetical protein [Streptomyces sp. NPDC005209]|uniref:hypothetical protein n=1 Tax=Streptomyces sp. NPDC005209 TaxID=3156715 RepID=UPI0033BF54F1
MGTWSAVCAALAMAGGAGLLAVLRALAFQLREASRRKTMTAVLRRMPRRGGSIQVTDENGITWVVRTCEKEGDGAG